MLEWMTMPLKRYADFSGRSRRKEYWLFSLFIGIIFAVLFAIMMAGGFPLAAMSNPEAAAAAGEIGAPGALFWLGAGLLGIFGLAIIVPSIAVVVRRLHDRDLSGWWYLGAIVAGMIPFVGFLASIALFVLMVLPGTPGPNRFGPDPKDPSSAAVFA
jgi:uncharacterized membrane protein YhaH (DUF805 family)